VNLSGGEKYYEPDAFWQNNIKINFLKPYQGSKASILERLLFEDEKMIKKEIQDQLEFMIL
jgi:hypothetical protein